MFRQAVKYFKKYFMVQRDIKYSSEDHQECRISAMQMRGLLQPRGCNRFPRYF